MEENVNQTEKEMAENEKQNQTGKEVAENANLEQTETIRGLTAQQVAGAERKGTLEQKSRVGDEDDERDRKIKRIYIF